MREEGDRPNANQEESFGQYLKRVREAAGLSVPELAQRSGVSVSHLSRVESGWRATPKPDIIERLAFALRRPAEEVFQKAGHAALASALKGQDATARIFLRAATDLTPAQAEEILEYIELRKRQWARERKEAERTEGGRGSSDPAR